MKKLIILILAILFPALFPAASFAEVDFGKLIQENKKAQEDLHQGLRENLNEARKVVINPSRERIVVVEEKGTSYTAPTNKEVMRFEKERIHHRSSENANFNRVASEINSLD